MKRLMITALISFTWMGFIPLELQAPQRISWDTLMDVEWKIIDGEYQIAFNKNVKKLNGKMVEIEGFIFPLAFASNKMDEFLLSANPISGCPYCAPGSSESFIMIRANEKVAFQYESITVEGKFNLTRSGQYGIIYEMFSVEIK